MELDDFIKLDKEEQLEIVSVYKKKPTEYRLKVSFEFYLQDYSRCESCENWFLYDDLTDTEGMLNGGIGKVCEQCLEDNDIKDVF